MFDIMIKFKDGNWIDLHVSILELNNILHYWESGKEQIAVVGISQLNIDTWNISKITVMR